MLYCYSAGCFCPNGTARHNGECISIDDCPKSMQYVLPIGAGAVIKLESTLSTKERSIKLYTKLRVDLTITIITIYHRLGTTHDI